MIGYRALPMRPRKAFAGEKDRMFSQICFASRKRALQEGMRRIGDSEPPASLQVEEVEGVEPYVVRWSEYPKGDTHNDVVLLPPSAVASSVVDLYLRYVAGDYTLEEVRRATDEEVERLAV
jgi:hypothetical protein